MRIAIGVDNLLVREGLAQVLERAPELELVASCVDLPSQLDAVDAHRPDAVLMGVIFVPVGIRQ